MRSNLPRRVAAEFLGTAFLVAAVVGSGIMAERLAGGNVALALLANTIATGAALVALILAFRSISGAHFNPVVSLADAMEGGLAWREAPIYIFSQVLGGIGGRWRLMRCSRCLLYLFRGTPGAGRRKSSVSLWRRLDWCA